MIAWDLPCPAIVVLPADHRLTSMSDPKAVFRDTLITGLADLCDILPGLGGVLA
jgi:hypothetical protein